MFDLQAENVSSDIIKFRIYSDSRLLQYHHVISLWQKDCQFRDFFIQTLSTSQYTAYRFETPSVCSRNLSRQFEFVLINAPWLDVGQDHSPFAEHFEGTDAQVIAFDNLGGDAKLVVPRPLGSDCAYSHLAAFLRSAPETQKHLLWQIVGQCITSKLGVKPIWLNTAGGGVDWLHLRLDSRPKYYAYSPYREA